MSMFVTYFGIDKDLRFRQICFDYMNLVDYIAYGTVLQVVCGQRISECIF